MYYWRSKWARGLTLLLLILLIGSSASGSLAQSDETVASPATPQAIDDNITPEATIDSTLEPTAELTPESSDPTPDPETTAAPGPATPEPVIAEPTVETTPEETIFESAATDFYLYVIDQDENPLPGTCWDLYFQTSSVPFESYCDSDDGTDDGTVTVPLSDFPSNSYYFFGSNQPPAGYPPCGNYCTSLFYPLRSDTSVTQQLIPYADVTIYKVDENGDPLPGACFEMFPRIDEVCDIDDGTDDGTIFFEDVTPEEPPRDYLAYETVAPPGYYLDPRPHSIEVYGTDVELTIENLPEALTGELTINKVDDDENLLLGACFDVIDSDDLRFGQVCDDNDDLVDTTDDGVTHYLSLPPGTYDLFEMRAPEGFGRSFAPASFTIVAGEETEIDFVNYDPVELTINKVDADGDLVPGACFQLHYVNEFDSESIESFCDYEDGAEDGINVFLTEEDGVGPGTYWIEEDQAPSGYDRPAELFEVTLEVGENETTIVNYRTIYFSIDKFDENGQPLAGSCFTLISADDGGVSEEICDVDDSSDDGYLDFGELPEGEYNLFETQAPTGYVPIFPLSVVLESDDVRLEVTNVPLANAATLTIEKVDESDDPLAGACFAMYEGGLVPDGSKPISSVAAQTVCDADDGENDGTISFDPVPLTDSGLVSIVESTTPAGYVGIDPFEVELELGDNTVTVENELAPEPTAGPTLTPDPEDDEDVTTLPNTGAGAAQLSTGGVLLMLFAAFLVMIVAFGRTGARRP